MNSGSQTIGTSDQRQQLNDLGFVVLENFIDADWLSELQAATESQFQSEGENAGREFKQETGSRRLANLVNKGDVFRRVISEPRLLHWMEYVLGSGFKLSSLNARSANPKNSVTQPLHADMGAVADELGFWVCNSVWLLTDFTLDNGPLRVVPGSHHWNQLPSDVLSDPMQPHPDEQIITGHAGSVVIMNAHTWHGGTANRTNRARTAIHAFFARHDKPQQQYQKQLLTEATQAKLTQVERQVLAIDDPVNDKVTSQAAQLSGFLK
jgi:ectoine hydroxylase-related dioxygenase (phytanoyl-CoA dioxygenase family)